MYCRCPLRRRQHRKNPISSELGSNIYTKRSGLGLSLSDVENKTGISRRLLSDAERGQAESLTVFMLQKLACALKCQPKDLLEGVQSFDISSTKSFMACDQCIFPVTGAQFKALLQHLEQVHNLSNYDVSQYLTLKYSSLVPYTYRQNLPAALQERISNWINRKTNRPVRAAFTCADCFVPSTGATLVNLLQHLYLEHFITDQGLADQLEIKLPTLKQYRTRKELPSSLVAKMRHLMGARAFAWWRR